MCNRIPQFIEAHYKHENTWTRIQGPIHIRTGDVALCAAQVLRAHVLHGLVLRASAGHEESDQ